MNLEPALQIFHAECAELLETMEAALLKLESSPGSPELINDVFRAAHTIKGTSGVFGFDELVAFMHQVESLLDRIRDGSVSISPPKVALLLECADHAREIIGPVTAGDGLDANLKTTNAHLIERLLQELSAPNTTGMDAPVHRASVIASPSNENVSVSADEDTAAVAHWHLSLRFGQDVIRNGMDPLSFLRYLTTVGDILHVETLLDCMPSTDEMDPEACYIGFEIALRSDADKTTIENVFEFVREDCQLRLLPPRSKIRDFVDLINDLPEDPMLLGDILIRAGALTETELARCLAAHKALRETGDASQAKPLGEILVAQGAVEPMVLTAALEKQQAVKDQKAQDTHFIRVDADKLDQLINLVGEMVIAGAGTQMLANSVGAPVVAESAANMLRLVEDVRNTALALRMVQIGATFQRFQRVVRDVSRELGKDIELVIRGAETELDKSVVEKIGDPLMHLVRNAMDHGIESSDIRLANGKSARAKVMLNAYHDSGSIVLEVCDDGAGLNREKILAKARDRGLTNENQTLSEQEIYQLIFAPGFSTADSVSNLSGRGVGMDVVRRNIEALRGNVELDSKLGQGTTVRIRLPLTLAIIDGFLISIAKAKYVIPVDTIVECVELDTTRGSIARDRGYTDLRNQVLPCFWLRDLFECEPNDARRENIVVVQIGGDKIGLVVDELHGESQIVIKPLGTLFAHLQGISGSTILGSGDVALILDVAALVKGWARRARPAARQSIESIQ